MAERRFAGHKKQHAKQDVRYERLVAEALTLRDQGWTLLVSPGLKALLRANRIPYRASCFDSIHLYVRPWFAELLCAPGAGEMPREEFVRAVAAGVRGEETAS